ncbi:MAG: hypothetical protein ACYC9I_07880 [Desulfuromonadales bacterium]
MAETVQKVFKKEDMVTVPEFAKAIQVSRSHAYQLVEKGQAAGGVLAFRFGSSKGLRIPKGEIERLKQTRRVEEV